MNAEPIVKKRWRPSYAEVVVIVVVLASLIIVALPPLMAVRFAHYELRNRGRALRIKAAIASYTFDYGILPIPKNGIVLPDGDVALGARPQTDPALPPLPGTDQLFQGLCGNYNYYDQKVTSSSATGINPRNTPYLTVPKSSVDANGILLQDKWYSPTPSYFGIELDANHDGKLNNLPDPEHGNFDLTVEDSCAFWGNNGEPYTKPDMRWSTTY